MKQKHSKSLIVLTFLIFFYNATIFTNIVTETLIKTPNGLIPIEELCIGNKVMSIHNNSFIEAKIIKISKKIIDTMIIIKTNKEFITTGKNQLFYDPIIKKWIKAKNLTNKNTLIDSSFNNHKCISLKKCKKSIYSYEISLEYPHTFFIGNSQILTHNFAFFAPAIISTTPWVATTIKSLTFGLAGFFGLRHYRNHKKYNYKNQNKSTNTQRCSCQAPNPEDPEKNKQKERKFNTITKTEFFKKIKNEYSFFRNSSEGQIYKRKPKTQGLGEKAEYIYWDHLHNDVEAFNKSKKHIGSYDPVTLKLYKPPVTGRRFPK